MSEPSDIAEFLAALLQKYYGSLKSESTLEKAHLVNDVFPGSELPICLFVSAVMTRNAMLAASSMADKRSVVAIPAVDILLNSSTCRPNRSSKKSFNSRQIWERPCPTNTVVGVSGMRWDISCPAEVFFFIRRKYLGIPGELSIS